MSTFYAVRIAAEGDAPAWREAFMRELAERTGGEYRVLLR
jgi:hypothetical protein